MIFPTWRLYRSIGLWNRWLALGGHSIDSASIITTRTNPCLAEIHHRMPVILDQRDQETWLDADVETATLLLKPANQPNF